MKFLKFWMFSSLLILLGIIGVRIMSPFFGSGSVVIAVGLVIVAWLVLLLRYNRKSPTSAVAHATEAYVKFVVVFVGLIALMGYGTLWLGPKLVNGFFDGLSVIDGSHGASRPHVPQPTSWFPTERSDQPVRVQYAPPPAKPSAPAKPHHHGLHVSIAPKGDR